VDRNAWFFLAIAVACQVSAYLAYNKYVRNRDNDKADREKLAGAEIFRSRWPVVLDPPHPLPRPGVYKHPHFDEIFAAPSTGNPQQYSIVTVRWGQRIGLCPTLYESEVHKPEFWRDVYNEYAMTFTGSRRLG